MYTYQLEFEMVNLADAYGRYFLNVIWCFFEKTSFIFKIPEPEK